MGRIENMITEDFMRQICIPLENIWYFGDGDGVDASPAWSTNFTSNIDQQIRAYGGVIDKLTWRQRCILHTRNNPDSKELWINMD